MAVLIAGVLCNEEVNDNSENFDILQGPQATKVYLCDWNQRWRVVVGMLGLNSAVTIGGGITINLPMRYPDFQQTLQISRYKALVRLIRTHIRLAIQQHASQSISAHFPGAFREFSKTISITRSTLLIPISTPNRTYHSRPSS